MRMRGRLDRLRQALGGLPPLGQLDLVVAVPVGSGMADDLPPGVHFNADGRVATVVFEGAGAGRGGGRIGGEAGNKGAVDHFYS